MTGAGPRRPLLPSFGFCSAAALGGLRRADCRCFTRRRRCASGDVRALAGFSSNVAVGELSSATRNAVNQAAGNPEPAAAAET